MVTFTCLKFDHAEIEILLQWSVVQPAIQLDSTHTLEQVTILTKVTSQGHLLPEINKELCKLV